MERTCTWTALVVACLSARGVVAATATQEPDSPVMSATVWRHEVVREEPILVRIEIANPSDHDLVLAAPQVDCYADGRAPLSFTLTTDSGALVKSEWPYSTTGTEAVNCYAAWWSPGPHEWSDALPPPPSTWTLPPGAKGHVWIDLLIHYPWLARKGRYHVELAYDSRDLKPSPRSSSAPRTWAGCLTAACGSITVSEPATNDQRGADELAKWRTDHYKVLLSWERQAGPANPAPALAGALAGTVYEQYAAANVALHLSEIGDEAARTLRTLGIERATAAGVAARYPGNALAGLLELVPARQAVWQAKCDLAVVALPEGAEATSDQRRAIDAAVDATKRAVQTYRREAQEAGDYGAVLDAERLAGLCGLDK